jgi:transcription elongation GreA/GreB family factor
MSSAFVRDQDVDHLEMPERQVSQDPNDVTESGLAQIEDVLAKASEAYDISRASADRSAFAAAERDLRYWTARRATARVVSASRWSPALPSVAPMAPVPLRRSAR